MFLALHKYSRNIWNVKPGYYYSYVNYTGDSTNAVFMTNESNCDCNITL